LHVKARPTKHPPLPTARGTVWLKTTPHFAADEATVVGAFAEVDPGLVATLLGSAEHRILIEHIPGEVAGAPWPPPAAHGRIN